MKYTETITINKPRDAVIALFDDPDNLGKWQEGFVSMEHLDGTPGEPGARSRLLYRTGKREIEMVETLEQRDLPERFTAIYEARNVWNRHQNRFEEAGNATRWTVTSEFVCTGLFMRALTLLMPGAFRKQTRKSMSDFKDFAEGQ